MRFAEPLFLILFIPLILLVLWDRWKAPRASLRYPLEGLARAGTSLRTRLAGLPRWLRYAALALFILALARPQGAPSSREIANRGIDIMLALDTSGSMQALDFDPDDRLDAAKKVAKEFVAGRRYDRIGIVVFSGLAYTQCPLTVDHDAVQTLLSQTEIGMTKLDGTAIGSAIATAANRLKDAKGKSRVVVLLTDGRNNMGEVDPRTAARAAAALGVRIYTIGTGKRGGSVIPVRTVFGIQYAPVAEADLDEPTLTQIAETTGGKYFRATDKASLEGIFRQIDAMEKTEIKETKYERRSELFLYFLIPGIGLLLMELGLAATWLRKLP